ncbi:MAG: ABC transporter transmembrane domain-containing protein, partial [Pusillimonas sp.]
MTPPTSTTHPATRTDARQWLDEARSLLSSQEQLLGWMPLDLDDQLRYRNGILVLTSERLLSHHNGQSGWDSHPLDAQASLTHTDQFGVGHFSLGNGTSVVRRWHHTLNHGSAARQLTDAFEHHTQRLKTTSGSTIEPEAPEHESRAPEEVQSPPSTWALFRLWRFARPYQWPLFIGFMLTLASTAAALVPPYLTMPLMDKVLIPFQNGKAIDWPLVQYYLGGLLLASLLAWVLGWGRTYILAKVSERIGADLRTTAYQHLQTLSLQYFGGKRTGDLISRIGSESDRLCVFLSLHLLDFLTDVLMIVMTAVILFSINPWLAVVTLIPLPFIVWLI